MHYRRIVPEAVIVWETPGGHDLERELHWALPQECRLRHLNGYLSEVFDFGDLPLSGVLAYLEIALKAATEAA